MARRRERMVAGAVVVAILFGGAVWGIWKFVDKYGNPFTMAERCYVTMPDGEPLRLTYEQARNAAIIVAQSYNRGLPERAAVVALATAWQESSLRNIDYGDRDSLGLFQQRPSQGWGTEAEILDPWYSSGRFYDELVKWPDWAEVDINDMAQKVQRSAYPQAYRKHVPNSEAMAAAMRGSTQASMGCVIENPERGSTDVLERAAAEVPGVTVSTTGTTITITAEDSANLWAAAHLAMANAKDAGITGITVGDKTWQQSDKKPEWSTASDPAPANTAVITLVG